MTIDGDHNSTIFTWEVTALQAFDHPNIVAYKGHLESSSFNYDNEQIHVNALAMENCNLGEMFDYVANTGWFEEEMSRYYFVKLINGLMHMQDKGFSHWDLKFENILISTNYSLKIADMGFATTSPVNTSYKGTQGYMAPEILAGDEYQG